MARSFIGSIIDGIQYGWNDGGFGTQNTRHPSIRTGRAIWSQGQSSITSGGNVANQFIHTFSLGALAAGAATTVVLANTLVNATTVLWGVPIPEADLGAGVVLQWYISARSAGISITLGVRNIGGSAMGGAVDVTAVLLN